MIITPQSLKTPKFFSMLLAACLLLSGINGQASASTTRTLSIVTSFSILKDLIQQVAGDRAQVTSLVGIGGDAHSYSPSPSDSVLLARADLIVVNGLGFDEWLRDLAKASGTTAPIFTATAAIRPIMVSEEKGHSHGGHSHSHEGGRVPDPHHWHDADNVILTLKAIELELSRIDPAGADFYSARNAAYAAEFRELDQWARKQFETIPRERRKLVTSHDSIAYLARRYQLRVVNTAMGSLSTESADPSAGQLAAVIRSIRKEKVPAVFFDTTHSGKLMEQIASETGVKVAPPLYTDSLGDKDSPASTTLSMLRHNVNIITQSLGATR